MFYHAYDSYMNYGYPCDEVKPISCTPRQRENRGTLDDTFGNYKLSLIESLGTLIILEDTHRYETALINVIHEVDFDQDVEVSVFEATIRVVGGLLSAHLLTKERNLTTWYNDELLYMARALVERLTPAFQTRTGIPYARVNLRYGTVRSPNPETCTACAGTLLVEFGLLSKLTSNPKYEKLAQQALTALWERRSVHGLMGNTINPETGQWIDPTSGIGAGADSCYEYMLKSYLLFENSTHLEMFIEAYQSVEQHLFRDHWYMRRDMNSKQLRTYWIDSLSAFWPGLQALIGDVKGARRSHENFFYLWQTFGGLPERYDIINQECVEGFGIYPLRPEFVESTYLLYRKTKDPYFLYVGKEIMALLQKCRVACGFATVENVLSGKLEDRMDSFVLSETLKYLILLYDEENFIHEGNYIFTTEGHVLPVNNSKLVKNLSLNPRSTRTQKNKSSWDRTLLMVLFIPTAYIYVLLFKAYLRWLFFGT